MINGAFAILTFLIAMIVGFPHHMEIQQLRLECDISFYKAVVYFDPVFVVYGHSSWAFFNTICLDDSFRDTEEEAVMIERGMEGVEKFRSLGWLYYPTSWFVDMHKWEIPPLVGKQYHFLTLELHAG
jgi:hypothetical protein